MRYHQPLRRGLLAALMMAAIFVPPTYLLGEPVQRGRGVSGVARNGHRP